MNDQETGAVCCLCNWTNINLLNLGEPDRPRWICHGCCKRMLDALEQLRDGEFAGTPINRNSSAMLLIEETLSPKWPLHPNDDHAPSKAAIPDSR